MQIGIGYVYLVVGSLLTLIVIYRIGHSWAFLSTSQRMLFIGVFGVSFGAIQRGLNVAVYHGSPLKQPSGYIDLIAFCLIGAAMCQRIDSRLKVEHVPVAVITPAAVLAEKMLNDDVAAAILNIVNKTAETKSEERSKEEL